MCDTRLYPLDCTSAYCGRTQCDDCARKPALDDFRAWVERTGATRPDPVWAPRVYVAREAQSC